MVKINKKMRQIIDESREIPVEHSFAVYYCTHDGKSIVRFSDFNPQTEFVKVTNIHGISPNFEEITTAAKYIYGNNSYGNREQPIDSDGYEEQSNLNSIEETSQPQRELTPREMRDLVDMYRRMRRKLKQ